MKLVMKVLSVCAFTVSCYGGNIVGYTTEVSNGKTNVVTVSIKDDDDFRVVLRRPNGVNTGLSGSGGRVPETTQQTTQETTQQISNRRLLQLVPPGNMRNIVSLVMKNPHINIDGMAEVLGLTSNGIKYHIKRLRTFIKFKHVGALQAGHWEIGPKP